MIRSARVAAALALSLTLTIAPAQAGASSAGQASMAGSVSAVDQQEDLASPWSLLLQPPSSLPMGSRISGAVQLGTADVDVDVVTLDGGAVRAAPGLGAVGAFDYPKFEPSSTPPRAVMRVRNGTSSDALAPGRVRFVFGADFALDADSTGNRVDNGDNLIQRGLYGDSSQYKIDVDGGNLSCRIKGSAGSVMVKSSATVRPGVWYRARCFRVDQRVTFTVTRFLSDGTTRTQTDSRWGSTGALLWSDSRTPVSVGGKLATNGHVIESATDQFNGLIGKPMINILD